MDDRPYFIEVLLSKKHKEPLQMVTKEGEPFSFKKIGVKQYVIEDKEILYCVLTPLENIDGIESDSLLLYRVREDNKGNIALHYEQNDVIIQDILNDTNV